MHPAPKVNGLDLSVELCCLFSRSGLLLWRSPAWVRKGCGLKNDTEVLARGWQEFVHPADLPRVLAWLASDKPGPCKWRAFALTMQSWVECCHNKLPYGRDWLLVGDYVALPAAPCERADGTGIPAVNF